MKMWAVLLLLTISLTAVADIDATSSPTIYSETLKPAALRTLLREGNFHSLNQHFEQLQEKAEQDVRYESHVYIAFQSFEITDSSVEEALNDWPTAFPDHWAPHVARAYFYVYLGYSSRGTKSAKDTMEGQHDMHRYFLSKASADLQRASSLKPNVAATFAAELSVAKGLQGPNQCRKILDRALAILPASFLVRSYGLSCLEPRWGGSYEEMQRVIDEAQQHLATNPELVQLLPYIDYDKGLLAFNKEEYRDALSYFTAALQHGDTAYLLYIRGRVYLALEDREKALQDFDRAIKLDPDNINLLMSRIRLLLAIPGGAEQGARDLLHALTVAPENRMLNNFRAMYAGMLSSAAYSRIIKSPKDPEEAIRLTTLALELKPSNAKALETRSRARSESGDIEGAVSDLREIVRHGTKSMSVLLNLQKLVEDSQSWEASELFWTEILESSPDNGTALFYRAKARAGRGDTSNALLDAKHACLMKDPGGCRLATALSNK